MSESRILILATLDTKGEEARFLARCIASRGHLAELLDLSLSTFSDRPRAEAMEIVARDAAERMAARVADGTIDGVIGIGGGTGTWLAGEVMAATPHGFPKLIVSTITGRDATRDIVVLPSVVDIAGLNRLLVPVLANAAAAICGMAEGVEYETPAARPTVAVTMFGVTTEGGTHLRRFLEQAGCEVVVFHATGAGGQTMERLTREGAFDLVIDWTTTEITDELTGGLCAGGPQRLEAAGECGIPQIVVPGAIDVINVLAPIPERFAGRTHHWHLPTVPLIRTSAQEAEAIGAWTGDKLARARGSVRVLIPAGGFSALDRVDGPFHDPAADAAWQRGLRAAAGPDVRIDVLDDHINDESFARATADAALALVPTATEVPR